VRVLNIEVPGDLAARWVDWLAPARQPFLLDRTAAEGLSLTWDRTPLSPELRDTYEVYEVPDGLGFVWLEEERFLALPRADRVALVAAQRSHDRAQVPSVRAWRTRAGERAREQTGGHRFVWWPSLVAGIEEDVLTAHVEEDRRPSRHDDVPDQVWARTSGLLPGARPLAGTFPPGSGPNCFGTVMAASGVPGAVSEWMQREPFEEWLCDRTRPGGSDGAPGTVLVWRSPDGLVQHAAVTLGGGWALHKPSQGWFDPVKVLTVDDVKRSARSAGRRLHRHLLRP
jgi:hypothetical protein